MSGVHWDWASVWKAIPYLAVGLETTVLATLFASFLAFAFGLIWIALRLTNLPVVGPLAELAVSFFRGTPFLVQLYFIFYVLPNYGVTMPALVAGILALAICYSAPVSEIYRAGIESIAPGQWEACLTLGLPIHRVWCKVILPQTLRTIAPMLGNIVIVMFKETAVLSTITAAEIMLQAMDVAMQEFRFVEPLTIAGLLYFIISYTAAKGVSVLEKWSVAHA